MFSRRRFLQSTTTAASVAALSHLASASEASSDCKPQSPVIAKLQSLKEQAQPITAQERSERQEKARNLMQTSGIDAIVLMPGTSLRYFIGVDWWPSERMFAMVLPAKGKAFLVCPAFDKAAPKNSSRRAVWQAALTFVSGRKMRVLTSESRKGCTI